MTIFPIKEWCTPSLTILESIWCGWSMIGCTRWPKAAIVYTTTKLIFLTTKQSISQQLQHTLYADKSPNIGTDNENRINNILHDQKMLHSLLDFIRKYLAWTKHDWPNQRTRSFYWRHNNNIQIFQHTLYAAEPPSTICIMICCVDIGKQWNKMNNLYHGEHKTMIDKQKRQP